MLKNKKLLNQVDNLTKALSALQENNIKEYLPAPVQKFDDVDVNLMENENLYNSFIKDIANEKNPNYNDLVLYEAINEISATETFQNLTQEQKDTAIRQIIDDYADTSKNKLRNDHDLVDQMIFDNQIAAQNKNVL